MTFSEQESSKCEDFYIQRNIDVCKINEQIANSMYLNVVLKDFMEKVKFNLTCPYRAGHYEIMNLATYLPPNLPIKHGFYCLKHKILCRFPQSKGLKEMVEFQYRVVVQDKKPENK